MKYFLYTISFITFVKIKTRYSHAKQPITSASLRPLFLSFTLNSLSVFAQNYASLAWKDVEDGFMELYFCNRNGLFIFGINQRVINGRTAIQEPTTMPMTCSPNPTTGVLDVVFDPKMSGNMVLEVVNTEGVLVFQKNLQIAQSGRQQQQIDLNALNNGLYILKMKAQNEVAYRKLVISK
jgi:Secretion system C-terminal sorting domain